VGLFPLFRKEWIALRRNLGVVVVLLILLPGVFVAGTVVFERTIPEDVPMGVVAGEGATQDEVDVVSAGISVLSTPRTYDTPEAAREGLQREEVYLVVIVPAGILDPNADVTFTIISDNGFVPLDEPAAESADLIESLLDSLLPASVTVDQERQGSEQSLSEFLVPTGLFTFLVLYGLIYLPYQVHADRNVIDRLRTESAVGQYVTTKLAFGGLLLAIPFAVVAGAAEWIGYEIAVVTPLAAGVAAVSFLALAAGGLAVLFVLGLGRSALFVNLGLSIGVLTMSSLLFPVGFFSPLRTTISRALPTHYAMITLRSAMLRDAPAALYTDYLLWIGGWAVASLCGLWIALVVYGRRY